MNNIDYLIVFSILAKIMKKFTHSNSSGVSTVISLSLVLFVVGLLAFVLLNSSKVSNKMKESIVFTIMLKNAYQPQNMKILKFYIYTAIFALSAS